MLSQKTQKKRASKSVGTGSANSKTTTEGAQRSASGHVDLARHEIRDNLAQCGISDLEIQHKLATDVFMCDEDRETYQERGAATRAPIQPNAEQAPSLSQGLEQERPVLAKNHEDIDLSRVEAPLPPSGPFSGPALGGEGAVFDRGMRSSTEFMGIGIMAVPAQGLLAPRAAVPFPDKKGPRSPSPKSQSPKAQGPKSQGPAQKGGPRRGAASDSEARSHFQPVKSHFQSNMPSPWQKKGRSPIEEIISKLIDLIKSFLGINRKGSYRGGRPELGRGK